MDLPYIDPNRKYWLIRTQSGDYYEEFYHENYVAIGWDELSDLDYIRNTDPGDAAERVRALFPDERRVGYVFKQTKSFVLDVRIGDIVLIPNKNSKYISFGEVLSDTYVAELDEDDLNDDVCPFVKRRQVRWLKTVRRDLLDPYLYRLLYSHIAITNASEYGPHIDRTLHSFFLKGDEGHLVLRVTSEEKVLAKDLSKLLHGVSVLLEGFDEITGSDYSEQELEVKVNVQSPGPVEYIAVAGVIVVLGHLMRFVYGGIHRLRTPVEALNEEQTTTGVLQRLNIFREEALQNTGQAEELIETSNLESTFERLGIQLPEELTPGDDDRE